jgi:hypothetical protein
MPRMRNLPPYDANLICAWFAGLYGVSLKRGQKHFQAAASLSRSSAKANPQKWPQFLVFDPVTREWHGVDT